MGNHFHLAVETPQGNLSEGMRWLQATFANRFNRFRKETGRLFQGRFKSLVVEDGERLARFATLYPSQPGPVGGVPAGATGRIPLVELLVSSAPA